MPIDTILTAVLAALAGALVAAAWLGRPARGAPPVPAARDAGGCVALLVPDGALGPREEEGRLRDRIEDVLRRALPAGAELERQDVDRYVLRLATGDLSEAAASVEALRAVAARTHVGGAEGVTATTVSAGLARRAAGEHLGAGLIRATEAAAQARALGGDRVLTERDLVQVRDGRRRTVEAALDAGGLRYDLQPIVDLRDGTVVGMEALLRIDAEPGRQMHPGALIDVLERLPSRAAAALPDLLAQAAAPVLADPTRYVTFNVTGALLEGAATGACPMLSEVLERLPARQLVLEIVEDSVLARPERARAMIGTLRARGVRIALDDFGVGLSSLDRLRRLPADMLKLDGAFVADLGGLGRAETILRHLTAMARELGLEVIAEGVETQAQADALARIGIRYGQGFHFGRPAPAATWAGRLGTRR
jgi:EAL domain-containing protein (putative c-di-GMP-specific phosphodiesterase class I)